VTKQVIFLIFKVLKQALLQSNGFPLAITDIQNAL